MEKPFVAVHEMLPPTHCFIHQISTCVYTHNTDVRWWLELLKIIDSQKGDKTKKIGENNETKRAEKSS